MLILSTLSFRNSYLHLHYENTPIKYIENFISKNWKFSDKNADTLYIPAQNIDCGYSLEPHQKGGSNEYQ